MYRNEYTTFTGSWGNFRKGKIIHFFPSAKWRFHYIGVTRSSLSMTTFILSKMCVFFVFFFYNHHINMNDLMFWLLGAMGQTVWIQMVSLRSVLLSVSLETLTLLLVIMSVYLVIVCVSLFQTNWNTVVENFDDLNLNENLLRGVYAYGFEKPSAIQQRAILPCINGKKAFIWINSVLAFSNL